MNCLSEPQHEGSCGSLVWGGGGAVCFPSLEAGFGCCIFGVSSYFKSTLTFARTSPITCLVVWHWKRACRDLQSRLLIWSARTTPDMALWDGSGTSKGYPFEVDVMGQRRARLVLSLYDLGLRTRAGLCPDCSWPAWGLKLSHTMSPLVGMYWGFTIALCLGLVRCHILDGDWRVQFVPASRLGRRNFSPI